MSNAKRKFIVVIQWIFFIPIGIVVYRLSNILIPLLVYPFDRDFIMIIINIRDFGDYPIIGPLFIFIREVFNMTLAVYCGIYLVPKYKKKVYILISSVWLLIIIIIVIQKLYFFSIDGFEIPKLYRYLTEMTAQIVGLSISGLYIWRSAKKKDTLIRV